MAAKWKEGLQARLVKRAFRAYERRIAQQEIPYDAWIREKEAQERTRTDSGRDLRLESGRYQEFGAEMLRGIADADILVLWDASGAPDAGADGRVRAYFAAHPGDVLLYADEDEIEDGVRRNPWLKPDWSPDTFFSYFYFGSFVAIHLAALRAAAPEGAGAAEGVQGTRGWDWRKRLYAFLLWVTERGPVGHIDSVLYHSPKIRVWGAEKEFDCLRRQARERRGWPAAPSGRVSIIIPSKDQPGVLSTCIHSVLEGSTYRDFEMIVIDNGSNAHNRERILRMRRMMAEDCRFLYHYEPMEFNYSRMCNLGASMATGDYLLFLNDDIEAVQEDWLERMLEKAMLPHVGAVGVKLIYPNTEIIQHAGVTNIRLGPAHKLQFRPDVYDYYFQRSLRCVDVLAVTGACLLVRKNAFWEAGGFREDLRVSFNDVELCYHLHELGYVNVVRNDVSLVHHESLSRGADDSAERLHRLHTELDMLYRLHPDLYNRDPYYHRYLVGDVLDQEFYPGCRYDYEKRVERAQPVLVEGGLAPEWHNQVLRIGVEFAGDLQKWETGKPGGGDWFLQGWSFALQVDNCRYRFSILLKPVSDPDAVPGASDSACAEDSAGPVYRIPVTRQYRPDIDANLNGILNARLSGFCVRFPRDALAEGCYLIGLLWEDLCSRQKLYRFSAETLTVRP